MDLLKPIWMQMMSDSGSSGSEKVGEAAVTCGDERLTVEHYGVLMQNEYAAEAYVYAVLRNTSGQRLPIQSIQMTVKNGSGRALHRGALCQPSAGRGGAERNAAGQRMDV